MPGMAAVFRNSKKRMHSQLYEKARRPHGFRWNEKNVLASRRIRFAYSRQRRSRKTDVLVTGQTGPEDCRHRAKECGWSVPQYRLSAQQEHHPQRKGRVLFLEKLGIWNHEGQLPD